MIILPVPFLYQCNQYACGAAALEMIYKYLGIYNVSQEDIFNQYQELEPHKTGNIRISTDNLIQDVRDRGFNSKLERLDYTDIGNIKSLEGLLQQRTPVIVCQQYTKKLATLGHFRIIIGLDNNYVYFHDPDKKTGGECLFWTHRKFMDYWQPTGENVTGGIYFTVS